MDLCAIFSITWDHRECLRLMSICVVCRWQTTVLDWTYWSSIWFQTMITSIPRKHNVNSMAKGNPMPRQWLARSVVSRLWRECAHVELSTGSGTGKTIALSLACQLSRKGGNVLSPDEGVKCLESLHSDGCTNWRVPLSHLLPFHHGIDFFATYLQKFPPTIDVNCEQFSYLSYFQICRTLRMIDRSTLKDLSWRDSEFLQAWNA